MTVLAERTPLHIPALYTFTEDDVLYAVDGEAPNWIAVDARGGELLRTIRTAEETGAPLAFGTLRRTLGRRPSARGGESLAGGPRLPPRPRSRWHAVGHAVRPRALPRPRRSHRAGRAPRAVAADQQRVQPHVHALPRLVGPRRRAGRRPRGARAARRPRGAARNGAPLRHGRRAVPEKGHLRPREARDRDARRRDDRPHERDRLPGRREERPRIAGPLPREVPGVDRRGPPRDERPDPRRRHVREGARRREASRGHGLRRLADDGHDRGEPLRARRDSRARQARRREEPAPHVEPQARPRGRELERLLPRERPAPARPSSPSRTPPHARARRSTTWRRSSGA